MRIELDFSGDISEIRSLLAKWQSLTHYVLEENGPGGGNLLIAIEGEMATLYDFLTTVYELSAEEAAELYEVYGQDSPMTKTQ